MTNDPPTAPSSLASIEEAGEKQYSSVAKDYFSPKHKGVSLSAAKKASLWVMLAMCLVIMLPQILSERKRQEVAEEIRPQDRPGTEIQIPAVQSSKGLEEQKPNGDTKRQILPVQKIKAIDLRTLAEPPPGSEVMAILASAGANGTVKVRLTEDLILNGDIYASKNSVLIGNGQSSEDRLYIKFNRLVSPEGRSRKIVAEAFDLKDRERGLSGKKVSDQVFKIAASSALIFLGGVADSLQESTSGPFGSGRRSLRDAALSGIAQATTEHGRRYLDSLDRDNRIEVQQKSELLVIFESGDDKND